MKKRFLEFLQKSKIKKLVITLFICFIFMSIFSACSNSRMRNSVGSDLDRIDMMIMRGQYRDANSELKKIEKNLSASWDYISVYRRYRDLGENENASSVIHSAYKKFSDNQEICALYSTILLRTGKIKEACDVAAKLQGSRYGSIYAEALLKLAKLEEAEEAEKSKDATAKNLYFAPELFSVYYDAYTGSKNSYWLRNAAILGMLNGRLDIVRTLRPERYSTFSDAYFWALVHYDSGNYGSAENSLAQAKELYPDATKREHSLVSEAGFTAFYSDVLQALSETEKSESVREELLDDMKNRDAEITDAVLPYIYVNSAEWASGNGETDKASELLLATVKNWPDFVPGLISYANFAYNSSLGRVENETQMALRKSGVATLEMQKYDNRAKIPVADAQYRMSESLARTRNPLLYIADLDLRYKTGTNIPVESKIADLWNILERNTIGINEYPPLLFEYALNMLIKNNKADDAFNLFKRYCLSHYSFNADADFWQQFSANLRHILPVEVEYAAWFAAHFKMGSTAQKLYEFCVWNDLTEITEAGGKIKINPSRTPQISSTASNSACINLAMIYATFGDRRTALELYSKAAGRTPDLIQRAEIMYRIACIYEKENNLQEASKNADLACSFNPSHAKAQLLSSRLSATKTK